MFWLPNKPYAIVDTNVIRVFERFSTLNLPTNVRIQIKKCGVCPDAIQSIIMLITIMDFWISFAVVCRTKKTYVQ